MGQTAILLLLVVFCIGHQIMKLILALKPHLFSLLQLLIDTEAKLGLLATQIAMHKAH
jgi:hypothetical protein